MKNLSQLFLIIFCLMLTGCTATEINKILQGASGAALTDEEVGKGLKEALIKGISQGAETASRQDGYFENELIRIALPEEFRQVEKRMRQFGLGEEVDRVLLAINRGAENAAGEAKPIFIQAIQKLTIQDAFSILKGGDDAATDYLKKNTSEELTKLFKPKIQESLDKVGALRYYKDLVNAYNAIPTTKKLDPDLNAYVTQQALDGLFLLIAEEERKIRENPLERTSALLRRVFAAQDL